MSVLGNDAPEASVPGEILPGREVVRLRGQVHGRRREAPDPGAPVRRASPRSSAASPSRAFQAIDAAGLARVDFFLDTDERIWVNEINTIPGFTRFSAYPRLWEASGLAYPALVDRLIALALERHARKRRLG